MRVISRTNRSTSSNEMLANLNIMNVNQWTIFRIVIFIKKIVSGQAPEYLLNKIKYKYENEN